VTASFEESTRTSSLWRHHLAYTLSGWSEW